MKNPGENNRMKLLITSMKRQEKIQKQPGSITVEAAFLLPFLMVVFLLMIWMSLYLHDRLVIDNAVQRLAVKGGDYMVYGTNPDNDYLPRRAMAGRSLLYAVSGDDAKEKKMETWIKKSLDQKLFLFREEGISVNKSGCNIKLDIRFRCQDIPVFSIFLPESFYEVKIARTFFYTVREELTRAGSVILGLL